MSNLKHVSVDLALGNGNPQPTRSILPAAAKSLRTKAPRALGNGKRSVAKANPTAGTGFHKGKRTEVEVARILTSLGFSTVLAPHPSPFDIGCNGARIEVKYASLCYARKESTHNHWAFNIHRHGKVDESQVDVYVLVCGGNRIAKCRYMLVMPAPLNCKTFYVSTRSLRGRHARHLNRWELIAKALQKAA